MNAILSLTMSVISDIFVAIFATYLAFTNSLAGLFLNDTLDEPKVVVIDGEAERDSFLSFLPSQIKSIPDILLRSAEYQEATLAGAVGLTEGNTTDPLEAIVNIFCTYTTPEYVRTTTGTGFFVDPDGVIMTNAHVAQMLLLEQRKQPNGWTV